MTSSVPVEAPAGRPLRRDAERNRQRILEAARDLFAQRGLAVSLDDVARHAGLGVGTVYRRFPDKTHLIDALFEERLEAICDVARAALEMEDPWEAFVATITGSIELQVADRGLKELLFSSTHGRERVRTARARITPLGARVIARAQAAGELRADFTVRDVPLVHAMVGAVVDAGREVDPELWRRYLGLLLDGLRAGSATPLPHPGLDEEALQAVLGRRRC